MGRHRRATWIALASAERWDEFCGEGELTCPSILYNTVLFQAVIQLTHTPHRRFIPCLALPHLTVTPLLARHPRAHRRNVRTATARRRRLGRVAIRPLRICASMLQRSQHFRASYWQALYPQHHTGTSLPMRKLTVLSNGTAPVASRPGRQGKL